MLYKEYIENFSLKKDKSTNRFSFKGYVDNLKHEDEEFKKFIEKIERTKELNSCPPGIPEKVILDFLRELKILNLG